MTRARDSDIAPESEADMADYTPFEEAHVAGIRPYDEVYRLSESKEANDQSLYAYLVRKFKNEYRKDRWIEEELASIGILKPDGKIHDAAYEALQRIYVSHRYKSVRTLELAMMSAAA